MSDNEGKSARAESLGMTVEQRKVILNKIDYCLSASSDDELYYAQQQMLDYVHSLIAAKDARIVRLQARQITPEMMAVWEEYQAGIPVTGLKDISRTFYRGLQSKLWLAFGKMMRGEGE